MKDIMVYFLNNSKNIKIELIIYILIAILTSFLSVCFPLCEGNMIDSITQKNILFFSKVIFIYGGLSIISIFLNLIQNKLLIKISSHTYNQMIMKNINHLFQIPYNHISKYDSSVISQELIQDSKIISNFVLQHTISFSLNIFLFVFTIIIIFQQSIAMLFPILLSTLLYTFIYIICKKKIYSKSKKMNESLSIHLSFFYKLINSIKDIRLNSLLNESKHVQNKYFINQLNDCLKLQNTFNIEELFSSLINFFTQIFIFIYGFKLILNNETTIGTIIIISKYFSTLLSYSKGMLTYASELQSTKASFDRIIKWGKITKIKEGAIILDDIQNIHCENLSFSYQKNIRLINKNIDFKKGSIYWIKGKNGVGKSTLLDCIFGIYGTNYHGSITLNGINVNRINITQTLENNFSISQQIPYLFDGSIKDNLTCRSNTSRNNLNYYINGFGLNNYINNLPNKENTILNLFSDTLSGGEKQKISLIRTLISEKKVLVFDEPYTYLDENAKLFFDKEIQKLKTNSIIIIVSHEDLKISDFIIYL